MKACQLQVLNSPKLQVWALNLSTKIDEANVDTSNFVESINRWTQVLKAWACLQFWIMTKEFKIIENKYEEGVDLGF